MRPKRELDAYTLRAVARRLRVRAGKLRHGIQWKDVTWGRAAEADLWADRLLADGRRLETLTKKPRKAK